MTQTQTFILDIISRGIAAHAEWSALITECYDHCALGDVGSADVLEYDEAIGALGAEAQKCAEAVAAILAITPL